jgi:hypothetical protein
VLAGLVALVALSSVMSAPVSASPGPFWRQRAVGVKTNGVKFLQSAQEKFQSKGGEAVLAIPSAGIEVKCAEAQNKGTIWNNNFQGQGKVQIEFHNKCNVTGAGVNCTIAEPIRFEAFFHLAWTWDGTEAQRAQGNQQALGQKPDLIFTHSEVAGGAIPKESFVTLVFGKECGLASGSQTVVGFESSEISPGKVEEWVREAVFKFTAGKHKQHYWNGVEQVGVETELKAIGLAGTFAFEDTANTFAAANGEAQEIAIFEN